MSNIKLSYKEILRTCNYWSKIYNWEHISEINKIYVKPDGIHIIVTDNIVLPNTIPFVTTNMILMNNIQVNIFKKSLKI